MIIAGMISQLDINELKSFFNGEKGMQDTFTELSEYLIKKFVDELTIEEIEGIRNLVKKQIIIDMDLRRKLDNK